MSVRGRALLGVYSIAIELVVWIALVPLTLARIVAGRATKQELRERLGSGWLPSRARVLVHAISAGEMAAAEPLVARLCQTNERVLLSTGTHAGMASAARMAGTYRNVEACVFMPWDRWAARRWLQSLGFVRVVVMETEIWPNLFTACRASGIPLFIANGRIRSRDLPRYGAARGFFRPVLDCTAWIGAQTVRDRERFLAIGAPPDRVEVMGNLKFDAPLRRRMLPAGVDANRDARPLLVAGSTHAPEERWLFQCLNRLRHGGRHVRLVVVPRNIGRSAAVIRVARRQWLTAIRWSAWRESGSRKASWDVLVVDEFGWLTSFYEHADIAFVGGTLAPVGGHNVIEAAALGRPVIVGPHVDDIAAVVEELEAAGGIVRLPAGNPAEALAAACEELLDQPERRNEIGSAARAVCQRASGATERCCLAMGDLREPQAARRTRR